MKGLTMVPKRLRKLDIFNETYNTNVLSFQILMRKESCISTTTIGRIALCHIVWVGVWENEMGLKQKKKIFKREVLSKFFNLVYILIKCLAYALILNGTWMLVHVSLGKRKRRRSTKRGLNCLCIVCVWSLKKMGGRSTCSFYCILIYI